MSCRPRVFGACPPRNPGFEHFRPRKAQNLLPRLRDAIGSPLGNRAGCEPAKGRYLGGSAVGVDQIGVVGVVAHARNLRSLRFQMQAI